MAIGQTLQQDELEIVISPDKSRMVNLPLDKPFTETGTEYRLNIDTTRYYQVENKPYDFFFVLRPFSGREHSHRLAT